MTVPSPDPSSPLYGKETAKAAAWSLSPKRMPIEIIRALARVKAAAAHANGAAGRLPADAAAAIAAAAEEVVDGIHDEQFVISVFQTGSGTSTNMNLNEVLANRANALLTASRVEAASVHPNDDVNRCQSSNDVMPTATQIALLQLVQAELTPAMTELVDGFDDLADRHWDDVRDGRTHLMRAAPIRLGQRFRGYGDQLRAAHDRITAAANELRAIPLGGTAIGTGIGCPDDFVPGVCAELESRWAIRVHETSHHLGTQGGCDVVANFVVTLGSASAILAKVTNDIRWLASDAMGELALPAMQAGSSIMPGKVNPVVCEAVLMACAEIAGSAGIVTFANSQGQFELHTMIPLVATKAVEATQLLVGSANALATHALADLTAPTDRVQIDHNPMLVTALAPTIGYDRATQIAVKVQESGRPVLDVAREEVSDVDAEELARLLDPARLTGQRGRRDG